MGSIPNASVFFSELSNFHHCKHEYFSNQNVGDSEFV